MSALAPVLEHEHIGALGFFPLLDAGQLVGKFMTVSCRLATAAQHETAAATWFAIVRVGRGMPVEPAPVDLLILLRQVIDEFDGTAQRRGVRLITKVRNLFEPMTGGEHRRHRSDGLGLGLYITHQIIKAHGGSIEAKSSETNGTTFTTLLPRVSDVSPQSERRQT